MIKVKVLITGRPEDIKTIKPRLYSEKCIFVDNSQQANIIFLAIKNFDFKTAFLKIDEKYKQLNKKL
jgi:hypothetical protein